MCKAKLTKQAKLAKMEAEMKMVFQQKVQEKESKLKQSEEELYARHREMKEALEKQRLELEDKKRRIESGRPLTPEKGTVSILPYSSVSILTVIAKETIRSRQVAWRATLGVV
jgi:septin 7